jgi:O-antigen ligase
MSSIAEPFAQVGARLCDLGYRFQELTGRAWTAGWVRQTAIVAGLLLLGAFWGTLVALAGIAAVLLFVAIFCCVFILRDFRVGVGLLIAIMPISQSYMFPHAMFGVTGLNPLNLLLAATLGVYAMRAAGSSSVRHFVPMPLFVMYLLPLIMGAIIGMGHVHEIPAAFKAFDMIFFDNEVGYVRDLLLKPLTIVIYALLVAAAVWRSKRPERFLTPLLISVWIMAFMIIGFVVSSGVSLSYLAGTYSRAFYTPLGMHANDLGRLYVVAYALLLFTWDRTSAHENVKLKVMLFITMVLATAAMVLTFSRGAFVGFAIVNLIYVFSRASWKTFALVLAAVPPFLYFLPGAVWSRLQAGKGEGADAVSAGRLDGIWGPLMPEIFDHPFFGNGLGAVMYSKAMRMEMLDLVAHPHNAFLEAYLNMGIVGFILIVGFWLWTWRRLRVLSKDERVHPRLRGLFEGAAAGLVSFLVAGFAGSSLEPSAEQAFLWLAIGIMFGISLQLKYGTKYKGT